MSTRIKVKKHDRYRALMSDVLPYETPMIFSNHGLHQFVTTSSEKDKDALSRLFSSDVVGAVCPYTVDVAKPNGDNRELHIPHPAHQIAVAEFLYSHSELILSLCNLSNFTIRAPNGVTSYFKQYSGKALKHFVNVDMDVNEDELQEDNSDETGFANSFFTYKHYTLLYKYYKSLEYLSLEKKYKISGKFDISKCFPSIYTKSLAWAVKGKVFAKKHKNAMSFENEFDELMLLTNDGESHGIIVGPEFSRVFAEIILQRIDVDVENKLEKKGLLNKKHYRVHRYVDDYFIYANSQDTIELINRYFKESLRKYKLYTNESKETMTERPFISPLGMAKIQIERTIVKFFSSLKYEHKDEKSDVKTVLIRNPYHASQAMINEIRLNVKNNAVSVESFSGLLFSIFREKISSIIDECKKIKDKYTDGHFKKVENIYTNYVIFCMDVVFYVYSQNIRVRTSYLLAQVLILINNFHSILSPVGKRKIHKKLRDESRVIFNIIAAGQYSHLETLNFVITLNELFGEGGEVGKDIKLKSDIEKYFMSGLKTFDYFNAVSALYVLSKKKKNTEIISHILGIFKDCLQSNEVDAKRTELTLFLLDVLTFPHIDIQKKHKIYMSFNKHVLKVASNSNVKKRRAKQSLELIMSRQFWFVNWYKDVDIREMLIWKEAQSTYH